jgi:D-alanyl-D-alanine carboxypeptidase
MSTLDDASAALRPMGGRPPRRSVAHEGATSRLPRALRASAIGLVLAAGLIAGPATPPEPVAAVGPLPACRLADILTVPRDYDSWSTTLVDWLLSVGKDYKPPDLVPVSRAGISGAGYVRQVAIDDLRALADAAAGAGTPIAVNSAYRSYAEQVASFYGWVNVDGYDAAITYSARPGHSEHQLGLTIDFMTKGGGSALQGDWATTPAGRWMANNAWKYGWVMSYPRGKGGQLFNTVTCFHYEPWHYRYLGRDIAAKVHAAGLTIREYLWTNFTQVDATTGLPLPTATPTPSPTPTPTPVETATPSAAPSAATQPASTWLGVDPPVLLGGVLVLVLAATGFALWRGFLRR